MSKELSMKQKKEWAQLLFLQNQFTQKEIAIKVSVSENTMSEWIKKGNWDKLRKSLLTTKTEILRSLYNRLDKINQKLDESDDIGDHKTADMFVKYTASIKNLETETSIAELMEAGRMYHQFLQVNNPQLAIQMLDSYDLFIKEKLKQY